jgi:hypothetical protein
MKMDADDRIRSGSNSCSRKRVFAVNWTFDGTVSDQCAIDLTVVREWTELSSGATCSADVLSMYAGSFPAITETWQASVKAEHGAAARRELGNFRVKDLTTLTIIRTEHPQ